MMSISEALAEASGAGVISWSARRSTRRDGSVLRHTGTFMGMTIHVYVLGERLRPHAVAVRFDGVAMFSSAPNLIPGIRLGDLAALYPQIVAGVYLNPDPAEATLPPQAWFYYGQLTSAIRASLPGTDAA